MPRNFGSGDDITTIGDEEFARAKRRLVIGVVGAVLSGCVLVGGCVTSASRPASSTSEQPSSTSSSSSSSSAASSQSTASSTDSSSSSSVKSDSVSVAWGSADLVGESVDVVRGRLEGCGFEQVSVEADSDAGGRTPSGSDKVTSVVIGGTKGWRKGSSFSAGDKVRIVCHVEDAPSQSAPAKAEPSASSVSEAPASSEPVAEPVSAEESVPEGSVAAPGGRYDFSGLSYEDVRHQFEQAGFTNIVVEADHDLITGWLHDDGDIENITVDGRKDYKKGEAFAPDVPVRIQYHTY